MKRAGEIWNGRSIVIETDVRDGVIGASLLADGVTNYLAVSFSDHHRQAANTAYPQLEKHLAVSPRSFAMGRNNAEILILSGSTPTYIWRYRTVRHAATVAWRASFSPLCMLALVGWLVYATLFRRYGIPRLVRCQAPDGRRQLLFVSRVLRRRGRSPARHFMPHALGVGGLFQKFEALGIKYAVLRWFDKLPKIRPGKDIDMLVADESLEAVLNILDSMPGIQATDVYTPSGLPKSDFYCTPYYPRECAGQLLDRTAWHLDFCRIPSALDHFHSLAYHAVYHNGGRSGLKSRAAVIESEPAPKHDYAAILTEMADKLGIRIEPTLEGVHEYLTTAGWAPQADMLARMAAHYPKNPWLKHLATSLQPEINEPGLTVYCIRQKSVEWGFTERIIQMLANGGWQILATKHLTPAEIEFTARRTRGGNWDKGFYKTSAGPPAVVVVAYDPSPIKPTSAQLRKDPRISNARLFLKDKIRDTINAELPPEEECSALHSTDYGGESWHFIDVYMPEQREAIRARIAELNSGNTQPARRAA
jgi:hypothetical protein